MRLSLSGVVRVRSWSGGGPAGGRSAAASLHGQLPGILSLEEMQ